MNAKIQVQVSAPVSVVSVGSNSLTLTAGGAAVTGTVSASGSVITFTPAAPLAVSTIVYGGGERVHGSGWQPGDAFQQHVSPRAVRRRPSTTAPGRAVSSVAPANAATNVPVGSSVVVTFNEAVESVDGAWNGHGAHFSVSSANLAGKLRSERNGNDLHAAGRPSPRNATVSVSVSGVTDLCWKLQHRIQQRLYHGGRQCGYDATDDRLGDAQQWSHGDRAEWAGGDHLLQVDEFRHADFV